MGGDGGSIPTRIELVKTKQKQKQEEDPLLISAVQWTTCSLTADALRPDEIVACELGNLYNKSSVIEFLLNKDTNYKFNHIKSIKHVLPLRIKPVEAKDRKKEDALVRPIFVCPITALPASGRYRFVYMKKCGCVLSEKAVKELSSTNCLNCARDLKDGVHEWVQLVPSVEEQDKMREELMEARASKHDKPAKKGKKRKGESSKEESKEEETKSESVKDSTASSSSLSSPASGSSSSSSSSSTSSTGSSSSSSLSSPVSASLSKTSASSERNVKRKTEVGLWGKAVKRADRPNIAGLKLPSGEELANSKGDVFKSMFLTKDQLKPDAPNLCSTKMPSCMTML